jgi:UDP-N-acetylglucosamine 1-carboxyvinyltransferase
MTAAILADEPVCLENIPDLTDVFTLGAVLTELGLDVVQQNDGQLRLTTISASATTARYRLVRRMRATFCVLGPLLARRGFARVALPGGCNLGHRPVDLHLRGLTALGAEIRIEQGYVVARAARLRGTRVSLLGRNGPTVTGTANVLCAATLARGTTVIEGAAQEPEIVDLAEFLVKLGARIEGAGLPTVVVRGVDQLGGTQHRIIPDRIEAATMLLAGAITRGDVFVRGADSRHLGAVLHALDSAGAELDVLPHGVSILASDDLRARSITAQPYPGFPSDVQPQWMALAAASCGCCTIRDSVFPHRLGHVAELCRLGATVDVIDDACHKREGSALEGTTVTAPDLRAGAALVLAALAAKGTTTISGYRHLRRGYQDVAAKFFSLGARIAEESEMKGPVLGIGP